MNNRKNLQKKGIKNSYTILLILIIALLVSLIDLTKLFAVDNKEEKDSRDVIVNTFECKPQSMLGVPVLRTYTPKIQENEETEEIEKNTTISVKEKITEEPIQKKPPKLTTETEKASPKPKNHLDSVPNGKGIVVTMDSQLIHPDNFDFGENQKAAEIIYSKLLANESLECIDLEDSIFTNKETLKNFISLFQKTVLSRYSFVKISWTYMENKETLSIYDVEVDFSDWLKVQEEREILYKAINDIGLYTGMSEKEAIIRINKYICDKASYILSNSDNENEILYSGKGKCWHYASLFQNICQMVDIQCDYVSANHKTESSSHGWNRVNINGTWYLVDVTWNDEGDYTKYLLLTSSEEHNNTYTVSAYY